jgi:hypothetical protein
MWCAVCRFELAGVMFCGMLGGWWMGATVVVWGIKYKRRLLLRPVGRWGAVFEVGR